MSKKMNVLIFPAGEINSVELHDALSANVNINLFGASSVDRHGEYIFQHYMSGLPYISDPAFLEQFNTLLDRWKIDFVFPTHDTIALYMADHQPEIHAKIITSSPETAHICRDKRATYQLFSEDAFCPQVYQGFTQFPCFIKPRDGQGAKGARCINNREEIPAEIKIEDYVITEYLPGEELTVDCLTDAHGKLQAVLPRVRNRLMAGVCVAGEAISATEEIRAIAEKINQKMSFLGLWYFQLKQDTQGNYKLLEISTRCAGTMCLSRARGINLPLLSVYAASGREIGVFENPYSVKVDRTLISRYKTDYEYQTVYIDYDDTIIVEGKVCLAAIRFLYQCRNAGKRIVLLTRHGVDHEDTVLDNMSQYAIPEQLFDQIVELDHSEEKSSFIETSNGAVFIDNAYIERKKVHDKVGIPVFDVEGIEVLLDWRT